MDQLDQSQSKALQQVLAWVQTRSSPWFSLCGCAGVGKTLLTAKYILPEMIFKFGLRVAVVAPTARASRVVASKLDQTTLAQLRHIGTIHSLLYSPVFDENKRIIGWTRKQGLSHDLDMIVVDESSMVGHEMEADLLSVGVPVFAVGDGEQLSPIEGKSTWMRKPSVRLTEVHRQALDSPVLRLATYVRTHKELPKDLTNYSVKKFVNFSKCMPALLDAYDTESPSQVTFLCFTNKNRCEINKRVHNTLHGTDELVVGTQIVCLRNNHELSIYNGERGFIESNLVAGKDYWRAVAAFEGSDKSESIIFPIAQVGDPKTHDKLLEKETLIDMGYISTVHKSQGSSYKKVFILLDKPSEHDDKIKWLYTGITRAVDSVSFCYTLGHK